jgi:hypothetical protein
MKRLLYVCLFLVLSSTLAFAADLTGLWTADLNTGDGGSQALSFTLKQDGPKLTGSLTLADGTTLPITEGKIDGDKVNLTITYNGEPIPNSGTLAGDTIQLTIGGGPFAGTQMKLTRTPPAGATPAQAAAPGL